MTKVNELRELLDMNIGLTVQAADLFNHIKQHKLGPVLFSDIGFFQSQMLRKKWWWQNNVVDYN